jgi:hypothetical protein
MASLSAVAAAISSEACSSGSLVPDVEEGADDAAVLTMRPSVSEGDGGLSVTWFECSVESVEDSVKDGPHLPQHHPLAS